MKRREKVGTHQGTIKVTSRVDQGSIKERKITAGDFGEIALPTHSSDPFRRWEEPITLPGGCLLYRLRFPMRASSWGDDDLPARSQ